MGGLIEMGRSRSLAKIFSKVLILLRLINLVIDIFVSRYEKAVECLP
jgi:hypothetical protein